VAAKGLLALNVLQAGPSNLTGAELAQELVQKEATVPFFPHGIGHMLGIDVHDVGGLPNGKSTDARLKNLRLRKCLQPGFVVTVEPGLPSPSRYLPVVGGSTEQTCLRRGQVSISIHVRSPATFAE
jgi:Xaa-Pro aminopeptidase